MDLRRVTEVAAAVTRRFGLRYRGVEELYVLCREERDSVRVVGPIPLGTIGGAFPRQLPQLLCPGEVLALLHTHPHGLTAPSPEDVRTASRIGVPFCITDGVEVTCVEALPPRTARRVAKLIRKTVLDSVKASGRGDAVRGTIRVITSKRLREVVNECLLESTDLSEFRYCVLRALSRPGRHDKVVVLRRVLIPGREAVEKVKKLLTDLGVLESVRIGET